MKRTIQKNIRVTEELAKWMDNHPLSDNSLVNYGLYMMKQMEERLLNANVSISGILISEKQNNDLPDWVQNK